MQVWECLCLLLTCSLCAIFALWVCAQSEPRKGQAKGCNPRDILAQVTVPETAGKAQCNEASRIFSLWVGSWRAVHRNTWGEVAHIKKRKSLLLEASRELQWIYLAIWDGWFICVLELWSLAKGCIVLSRTEVLGLGPCRGFGPGNAGWPIEGAGNWWWAEKPSNRGRRLRRNGIGGIFCENLLASKSGSRAVQLVHSVGALQQHRETGIKRKQQLGAMPTQEPSALDASRGRAGKELGAMEAAGQQRNFDTGRNTMDKYWGQRVCRDGFKKTILVQTGRFKTKIQECWEHCVWFCQERTLT